MKKKIFLVLFSFVALFIIMLFTDSSNVYAAEGPNNLYLRTEIQRWSKHNDLEYVKNDSWSASWYDKSVYLTTASSGAPGTGSTCVEIEENQFITSGDGEQVFSLNGIDDFEDGATIYLVEKYNITDDSVFNHAAIGGVSSNSGFYIPSEDYIRLTIDVPSEIVNATFNSYTRQTSYQINVAALYDSEIPDSENRATHIYYSLGDLFEGGEKDDSETCGLVFLPVYGVKVDLQARGNTMPAGYFSVLNSNHEDVGNIMGNEATPTSELGNMYGYIIAQDDYSLYDYSQITSGNAENMDIGEILYSWESQAATSDGYIATTGYDVGTTLYEDSSTTNAYYITITDTIEQSKSIPNGTFFNILPFAIAGIVAVSGVVLLKKNSIKE